MAGGEWSHGEKRFERQAGMGKKAQIGISWERAHAVNSL